MKVVGLNLGAAPMGHSSVLDDAEATGSRKGREARPDSLGSGLHRGSTECSAKRPDGLVNAVAGGPAVGIGYPGLLILCVHLRGQGAVCRRLQPDQVPRAAP